MGRQFKHLQLAAAHTQAVCYPSASTHELHCEPVELPVNSTTTNAIDLVSDDESECEYEGGVNHDIDSDDIPDSDSDGDFTDEDLSEFDEEMLKDLLEEVLSLAALSPFERLKIQKSKKEWSKSEKNQSLEYNRQERLMKFWSEKKACDGAKVCADAKMSSITFDFVRIIELTITVEKTPRSP